MAPKRTKQQSATPSAFQERYEALKKLDPDIALQYAVAVNAKNREAIRTTGTTEFQGGFGNITKQEVDLIIAAATDGNVITEKEEEALLIILATDKNWNIAGVKQYMIEQIEKNLRLFWSATPIDKDKAALLLVQTNRIDFVSQGDKHQGTGLHYTAAEFQTIVQLIARNNISAAEVSGEGFYKFIPGASDQGYYDISTNEIYLVSGLSSRDQQSAFAVWATVAIHDFRNVAWPAKYRFVDTRIIKAFVALSLGSPYTTSGDGAFAVANRKGGAAEMLMTPVASRNAKWKSAFKKAYDEVVDAYVAGAGSDAKANKAMFLEDPTVQTEEKKVFMEEMKKALTATSKRSKP